MAVRALFFKEGVSLPGRERGTRLLEVWSINWGFWSRKRRTTSCSSREDGLLGEHTVTMDQAAAAPAVSNWLAAAPAVGNRLGSELEPSVPSGPWLLCLHVFSVRMMCCSKLSKYWQGTINTELASQSSKAETQFVLLLLHLLLSGKIAVQKLLYFHLCLSKLISSTFFKGNLYIFQIVCSYYYT